MDTFQLACPQCGAMLEADQSLVGRKAKCDQCGNKFTVLEPEGRAAQAVAFAQALEYVKSRRAAGETDEGIKQRLAEAGWTQSAVGELWAMLDGPVSRGAGSFAATEQWATKSVFVSSTFLDMQAERDFLRDYTFPAVAEQLRAQGAELVTVDLRWGVETADIADEAQREAHVLQVIRDEVLRCRPFVIVLLGDRYGWIPPASQLRALQTETERRACDEGVSVTALEIELGVFSPEIVSPRCYFYLRQPLPYDQMPPEVAARFSDAYARAEDAPVLQEKLAALKQRISSVFGEPGRVRSYTASWDRQAQRVTGLEELGELVTADLLREFAQPGGPARELLPWEERERRALGEFASLKRSGFVGRERVLGDLTGHALALPHTDCRGHCVTGEAGSGKSAVWAELCSRIARTEALLLASAAGVTPLSSSPHATVRRWTGELAAALGLPDELPEGASPSQVRAAFAHLLAQFPTDRPVVIALDAVTEMERTAGANELLWLPDPLPGSCFLVVTAIPGPEAQACLRRIGVSEYPLPGLDETGAGDVAVALCRKRGKPELNPDVRKELLGRRRVNGAPAHLNPLWLTLAVEHLVRLGEDDFRRAAQQQGRGDAQVVALLLDLVSQYPPAVAGMYDFLLAYAERTFGAAVASAYCSAITLSRAGWRDGDLTGIVSALSEDRPDPLHMANLRRGLGMHLVLKGDPERHDFAHQQMRQAVTARYMAARAEQQHVHEAIVGYLQSLPPDDPMRQSELMWHLIGADDRATAVEYLTMGAQGTAHDLAWAALGEAIVHHGAITGNEVVAWTLSLLDAGQYDELQRPMRQRLLHQQFAFVLAEAIERQGGSTELAAGFVEELLQSIHSEDRGGLQASAADLINRVTGTRTGSLRGVVQSRLAQMQERAGQHDAAVKNAQEAVDFLQSIYDTNATPAQAMLLRTSIEIQAGLLQSLGRWTEAGNLRRRALQLMAVEGKQVSPDEEKRVTAVAARIQQLVAESATLTGLVTSGKALKAYDENAALLDAAFLGSSGAGSPESVVRACAMIGELLMSHKDRRGKAKAYLQRGIEVGERLYYDEQSSLHAYDLASTYARQVRLLREDGCTAEAAAYAERQLALLAALVAADPSPSSKSDLAGGHLNLGGLLMDDERQAEGKRHLGEAERLLYECYCAAPSADLARDLAKCYAARAASLADKPDAQRYWKAAKDLLDGMTQLGLGNVDDVLLSATLQTQLAREGEPASTEGLATIETLRSSKWAQSFLKQDADETKRDEFNLAASEVEFAVGPSVAHGRPLLEEYGRLVYRMATTGRNQEGERYATRTYDLLRYAREHAIDLGPDVAAIWQALQDRPARASAARHIPGCALINGVWLREPIALALRAGDRDAAYFELARCQEQIARQGGLGEGLQLSLLQQAAVLAVKGQREECLDALAGAERAAFERGDREALADIFGRRARALAALEQWTAAQQAWFAQAEVLRQRDDTDGWFSAALQAVNVALLHKTEGDVMPQLSEWEQLGRRLGRPDIAAAFCSSRGILLRQRGRPEEALSALAEAAREARVASSSQVLLRALINQAQVLLEQLARPEDALDILGEASRLADGVGDPVLVDATELLRQHAHTSIGDARVAHKDLPGALHAYEAALAIAQRLVQANPGSGEWCRALVESHSAIADARLAQGDLPGALQAHEAVLTVAEQRVQADPRNAQWQRALSVGHNMLGNAREKQGDLPGALQAYEAALAIAQRLAQANPGDSSRQWDLVAIHDHVGDVRVAQGALPEALQAYEAGLAIAEPLAQADQGNAQGQRETAALLISLGKIRASVGPQEECVRYFLRGREVLRSMKRGGVDLGPWAAGMLEILEQMPI